MIAALNFGPLGKSELDRIANHFGNEVICSRCQASLATYANRCRVSIETPCPGFLLIEGLRLHIRRKADG